MTAQLIAVMPPSDGAGPPKLGLDIEQCPHCGGTLTIIAAIDDPIVIAKILTHLGLRHAQTKGLYW